MDLQNHQHDVQFYGSDESLFTTVGGFLSEGLVNGPPVILIATDPHGAGIVAELESCTIDR